MSGKHQEERRDLDRGALQHQVSELPGRMKGRGLEHQLQRDAALLSSHPIVIPVCRKEAEQVFPWCSSDLYEKVLEKANYVACLRGENSEKGER